MHHGEGLLALTDDRELVEQLKAGDTSVVTDPAEAAMLDYSTKLTCEPWTVTRDDVERLRAQGFDDRAILDIAQVVAYFAFVNRIADGLGVELEPERG